MTPTGVRLNVVRERLAYAERCVEELRSLPVGSRQEFLADRRNPLAAATLLHRAIEALFDTARHILAKGFGVGQLRYRQIAREVVDRGLITEVRLRRAFREIAGYRNRVLHHYEEVTPEELFGVVDEHLGDLEAVAAELGAVARRMASADKPLAHPG